MKGLELAGKRQIHARVQALPSGAMKGLKLAGKWRIESYPGEKRGFVQLGATDVVIFPGSWCSYKTRYGVLNFISGSLLLTEEK